MVFFASRKSAGANIVVEFASAQTITPSTHIAPIKTDKNTFFEVFMAQRYRSAAPGAEATGAPAAGVTSKAIGSGAWFGKLLICLFPSAIGELRPSSSRSQIAP